MKRRQFLTTAALGAAALSLNRSVFADVGKTKGKDGSTVFETEGGGAAWQWDEGFFKFPKDHKGFGGDTHAPAITDGKVFIGHTGPEGITVFDYATGNYVAAADFKFGALKLSGTHGLTTDGKYLYITTNAPTGRIIKTDLKGELVWEIAQPEGHEGKWNPTEVTIVDDQRILITNGYGSGVMYWASTKDGKILGKLFTQGNKLGEIAGCHGVMFDTATKLLWLHDRGNRRIQWSDLDGNCSAALGDNGKEDTPLRMPCGSSGWGEFVVVPDLEGRFEVFQRGKGDLPGGYKLVGQFGDAGVRNKDFGSYRGKPAAETLKLGQFGTPHYFSFTPDGHIVAAEWHPAGRVNLLRRLS